MTPDLEALVVAAYGTFVPANEREYEPLLDLVDVGETVLADKGSLGPRLQAADAMP
jgi:hypothetical protein